MSNYSQKTWDKFNRAFEKWWAEQLLLHGDSPGDSYKQVARNIWLEAWEALDAFEVLDALEVAKHTPEKVIDEETYH